MKPSRGDLIQVVERAYAMQGSEPEWLQNLCDAARPLLDHGLGTLAFLYRARPADYLEVPLAAASGAPSGMLETMEPFHKATPQEIVEQTYLRHSGCATASEMSGLGAALDSHPAWQGVLHPLGMHDYLATNALVDPRGRGCILGAPLPRIAKAPPALRRSWTRVAAHISAGMRLRAELGSGSTLDGADAVLSPSGRVEHAEPPAQDEGVRRVLREAAVRIDRARGKLRNRDPGEALELWSGLVSGRWSLVDQFEADGRRYVVARRNAPDVRDPRALALRERQVVWYSSLGHSNKLIAYELGIGTSSVATLLSRAAQKLGVSTRAELIALVRGIAEAEPEDGSPAAS